MGKYINVIFITVVMRRWDFGDKEKIFMIRKLQTKNRISITKELFDELDNPKKIDFISFPVFNNGNHKTVICIENSDYTDKLPDNSTIIASCRIEYDRVCERHRIVIPKEVLKELDYKGRHDERIVIFMTNRMGYKAIEIANLDIDSIKW
ncbi:MAG: hypothetical protein DRN17_01220 [Thermoplasmata archaeon]|nr:MAG: hypothetical protein DRN17_01220 [Thermoplasmata archaeon]